MRILASGVDSGCPDRHDAVMPWSFSTLRRVWGYGISGVLIAVILPYPLMAIVGGDDQVHRVHDTAGAVQYLLWWGVPIAVWTHRRLDSGTWLLALASALAIAGAAVPTGDLVTAGSWAPLATMLVLVPGREEWSRWWFDAGLVPVTLVLAAMAWRLVPGLVDTQDVAAADVHGARYHYGGMAAAYAAAAAGSVVALVSPSRLVRWLLAAGCVVIGVSCLVWPTSVSALPTAEAWVYLSCGAVVFVGAAYDAARARSASRLLAAP